MSLFDKYFTTPDKASELKIPRFGDIITEQDDKKKDKEYNVLILTARHREEIESANSPKWTVNRIKSWCEENKISTYTAYMDESFINKENDSLKIFNFDDTAGFSIYPDKTIAIVRGGAQIVKSHMMSDLVAQLQQYNIFCVNNLNAIESCGDKYRTYMKLVDDGLPCPRSVIIRSEDMIESSFKKIGEKYPVVVKLLSGSTGIGVFMVDSHKSLISVLQVIWKLDQDAELLMQEFIESDYDIRVHVLGDQVIAAMKRYVIKDDFRTNYNLGSDIEKIELDPDIKEICIKAAKSVGALWAGVDLIISKKEKKPYFLEINSSPGTYGIEKATKEDVVSKVMEYITNKDNWIKIPLVCGFQEIIDIDGIGSVVAKMDTGNGATCALHAEDIKINEEKKTVSWKTNGLTFKDRPYNRKIKLVKGSIGKQDVKKVTVTFNVKFSGSIYKNVEFALDNRDGKTTSVLVNRKFMRDSNIIVNPAKAFLLTISPFENKDIASDIKIKSKTDTITDDNGEE